MSVLNLNCQFWNLLEPDLSKKLCFYWQFSFLCIGQFWFFCVNSEPKLSILKLIWAQFFEKAVFTDSLFIVHWSILIFLCQFWTLIVISETYLNPICRKSCVFTGSPVLSTVVNFDFFCVNSEPMLSILKLIWTQFDDKKCIFNDTSVLSTVVNFDFFVSILNLISQFWNLFEPNLSKKLCFHRQFSF